jgi:4-amino-4-deoxy-L-arabinose transferase-like glycosyltransferase
LCLQFFQEIQGFAGRFDSLKNLHLYAMFQFKSKLLNNSGTLFAFSILLLILLPRVFQEGRFMDGMIYGSVARNLSEGQGNFWSLYFSSTLLQPFHEHPPMAFGLESLVFSLLGDVYYAEGIYNLIVMLCSAVLIFKLFRQHSSSNPLAWLAILLWITTERVFWCANENMLETTVSFFALLSVYFLKKSSAAAGPTKLLFIAISALGLICAFLSKGFVGLFPMSYFFFLWLVSKKQYSFSTFLKDSILLLVFMSFFSFTILWLWDAAYDSLKMYLQQQVFNSVRGHDRVGLRLPFIIGFFQQTLPLIVLFVFAFLFKLKNKNLERRPTSAALFFLLGLAAFLPLLVSPKLSFYYVVPSIPCFTIAVVLFSGDAIGDVFTNKTLLIVKKTAVVASLLIFVATLVLSTTNAGKAARDKDTITEVHALTEVIAPGAAIAVSSNLQEDWSLFAYMQRIGKYSVLKGDTTATYFLAEQSESAPHNYVLLQKKKGARLTVYKASLH